MRRRLVCAAACLVLLASGMLVEGAIASSRSEPQWLLTLDAQAGRVPASEATIRTNKQCYGISEPIHVRWDGAPGTPSDWVGIY